MLSVGFIEAAASGKLLLPVINLKVSPHKGHGKEMLKHFNISFPWPLLSYLLFLSLPFTVASYCFQVLATSSGKTATIKSGTTLYVQPWSFSFRGPFRHPHAPYEVATFSITATDGINCAWRHDRRYLCPSYNLVLGVSEQRFLCKQPFSYIFSLSSTSYSHLLYFILCFSFPLVCFSPRSIVS